MNKNYIKIGCIGCGGVVRNLYRNIMPRLNGLKVTYFYDCNEFIARETAAMFGGQSTSLEQLIRQSDAVIVATPPSSHSEFVSLSLSMGKRVLCEKPFTPTFDEARRIVEQTKQTGLSVRVGHFRRGYPAVMNARNIVATGALGPVLGISIYEGGRFSWATVSDYITKDPYGGVLLDTGSHALDQALFAAMLENQIPSVEIIKNVRDKQEPSHEIKSEFFLNYEREKVTVNLSLSRFNQLANIIRLHFKTAELCIPIGFENNMRLSGKKGHTILSGNYDSKEDNNYMLKFYWDMLLNQETTICEANSFLGQVKIMEHLLN